MAKNGEKKTEIKVYDWQEALRNQARQARAVETLGVPRITYKGGILTIDGKKVVDADGRNRLRIVPLAIVYGKEYYENSYEQGSTDTPVCYAFAQGGDKGMVPHAAAPKKQSEGCDTCPHNAFGTAERGRGKRCGDKRKLLVLLADDLSRAGSAKTEDDFRMVVKKAQHYQIAVPGGSLKKFGQFLVGLNEVTTTGSILEAVVSVHCEPSPTGAFTVEFEFEDRVPPLAMPALLERGKNAFELLNVPFPVIAHEEQDTKPVKGQSQTKRR